MPSVPFSISDNHSGASNIRGAIYLEGDEVVIEMQIKFLNLFKRPPQTFRFEVTDLEAVRHKRRVWGDVISIRSRPMDIVARMPGSADGELCLKVKRAHRRLADALIDRLDLWLEN